MWHKQQQQQTMLDIVPWQYNNNPVMTEETIATDPWALDIFTP
jgi:hypothetical protein